MDRPTTNLEEVQVYRWVSNHGTNTEASGMLLNDQPWLDCDPERAKNLAEAADIWERYAKSESSELFMFFLLQSEITTKQFTWATGAQLPTEVLS